MDMTYNPKGVTPATPLVAEVPRETTPAVPASLLQRWLFDALCVQRADGTVAEQAYVGRLVALLHDMRCAPYVDTHGNVFVDNRWLPEAQRTMFTAHTDTVHLQGGMQAVRAYTENGETFWCSDGSEVLGADDGAGIAVLLYMLQHEVPGLYAFFRGEEVGGTGSNGLRHTGAEVLRTVDRCISFDRAGYYDVITHQGGARCCSDTFATALAGALSTDDMSLCFAPSDTGVFTDSANLTDNVAECTNLSVGYFKQHTVKEHQNVTWLERFAAQCVQVEWDRLPVERDPREQLAHPVYGDPDMCALADALWAFVDGQRTALKQELQHWVGPQYMVCLDALSIKDAEDLATSLDTSCITYADAMEILEDAYTARFN